MTKRIKAIKINDTAAIQALLDEVNGRATSWTADVDDIVDAANSAEEVLANRQLAATYRKGAVAVYTTRGPGANAYRSAVIGNWVKLERFAEGWCVVEISRADIYPKQSERIKLTISEDQRDRIVANAISDFNIKKAA